MVCFFVFRFLNGDQEGVLQENQPKGASPTQGLQISGRNVQTTLETDVQRWALSPMAQTLQTPQAPMGIQEASREESLGKLAHAPQCRASNPRYLPNICNVHTYTQSVSKPTSSEATHPPVPRAVTSPTFIANAAGCKTWIAHL